MEFQEKVTALQKVNPSMPRELVEDLVRLYDQIDDPEYLEEMYEMLEDDTKFEAFCKKHNVKPFTQKQFEEEIINAGEVLHFETEEEQTAYLIKTGRLTQEEADLNKQIKESQSHLRSVLNENNMEVVTTELLNLEPLTIETIG